MKVSKKIVGSIAIFAGSVASAQAALPAAVGDTLTALQTDGLAMINLVWPVVGAITGGFLLFKLFKRGASKI